MQGWLLGLSIPSGTGDKLQRGGEALGSGLQLVARDLGERLAEAADVGFEVPGGDARPGSLAHALSLFRAGEDAGESGGKGLDVADGKDKAFDAIGDEIGVGAYFVGDDDGAAGGHGFVDDEAPGLVPGGQDEDVGEREEGRELGLIAEAGEADAFEGEFACAGFEAGALFTVADDEEVGERVGGNGAETGIGFEEVVGVLARPGAWRRRG